MSHIQFSYQSFWLPKEGSSRDEYEDAFFPRRTRCGCRRTRFRAAVADGATEASFSRLWARILVCAFVRRHISFDLSHESLSRQRMTWKTHLSSMRLPWYAQEKLDCGAFAAFLGVEFEVLKKEDPCAFKWRAVAAGDACIVQMRSDEIIEKFPIQHSTGFSNRPDLLPSLPSASTKELRPSLESEGCGKPGDSFYLMTDAIATWFLRSAEGGGTPWKQIRDLDTPKIPSFRDWITCLRVSQEIKNDDVTVVRIETH